MPTFDVVSEVDMHELTNAVDQANRELANRYDFKGSGANVEQSDTSITLVASSDFQIKQIHSILFEKMTKRGIDIACLDMGGISMRGQKAVQVCQVQTGIDKELAKEISRRIKDSKLKVQAAIQDQQVRVSGKKRDVLQEVIALLKAAEIKTPLQFKNFRD
ncbi:MAG: YajQ family cyclic di-GMP-binding protein [Gammaproteobacteria bacterium]|nr:YajQ family cyclic di-GMP-binding protein [Gammaproteobacteria bacterium]